MVVVVGVQALQDEEAEFSLYMNGPNNMQYEITDMAKISSQTVIVPVDIERSIENNNPLIKVFKWYNWEHANFKIDVKVQSGSARVYLNHISETSYLENAYSVIGLNQANSEWSANLDSAVND